MTHQFAVGDIVRINNINQEAEVISLKEATGSEGPLLQVQLAGTKMYFPVKAVTLVRSAGEVQSDHPRNIET